VAGSEKATRNLLLRGFFYAFYGVKRPSQLIREILMPNIMLRDNEKGELTVYVPKKDQEDVIVKIEFNSESEWGGELTLGDGSSFIIEKMPGKPDLPLTVRAKRGEEA
jgi:nitrogen fixation protein NifT